LTETRLCALDDIPDGGSNGFAVEKSSGKYLYMAIRLRRRVLVYCNRHQRLVGPFKKLRQKYVRALHCRVECPADVVLRLKAKNRFCC